VCEANFDARSNCVILSGQSDDVRRVESDVRKKCLAAVCHDTVNVSQPGMIHRCFAVFCSSCPSFEFKFSDHFYLVN